MRAPAAFVLLLVFSAALAGCGRKPAQDYIATGTLSVELAPSWPAQVRTEVAQSLQRLKNFSAFADVTMTVRTSPDVGDVIAQRTWKNVKFPHEFGLGKKLGESFRKRLGNKRVYVTAMVDLYPEGRERGRYALVAWTPRPVDIGAYHIRMKAKHLLGARGHRSEELSHGWIRLELDRRRGAAARDACRAHGRRALQRQDRRLAGLLP